MLTERRNKNQKQHSEKVHSFSRNSDYTKVKKKILHIHHNTSSANLSPSSLADQRLSMWFLPVVMQYFIGHEIVLTIKTKLNSRLLYAGFHCILKLSVWAKIIENDTIYLKPRDWLTSRKIFEIWNSSQRVRIRRFERPLNRLTVNVEQLYWWLTAERTTFLWDKQLYGWHSLMMIHVKSRGS